MYGGGPLSVPVGNRLVEAGVPLRNVYGGTEFGAPMLAWDKIPRSSTRPDPDWHWYWILDSPDIRWDLQGDGTYELVVVVSVRRGVGRAYSLTCLSGNRGPPCRGAQCAWREGIRNC